MEKPKRWAVRLGLVAAALLWLIPSLATAQAHKLNCNSGKTIGDFLKILQPGATLFVSGSCNENLDIPGNLGGSGEVDRFTLDGQGTATINGPDSTKPTINIRVRGITVTGFTITGGKEGIHLQAGTARIEGNHIHSTGKSGIGVHGRSFAIIVNNTIEDNPNNGIDVFEDSYARIGVTGDADFTGSPNTIQGNGFDGIRVLGSSSAWIVKNTISSNGGNGIGVAQVSHGRISSNTINANGAHGISLGENSGVNLGRDTGNTIFDLPNTTTVNNGGFGIFCFINSYGNGRHTLLTFPPSPAPSPDPLNGASGLKSFSGSCIDSLMG